MADKIKHISLRINEETLQKLHYVCAYEGRSINGQLLVYIRDLIADFEKEHGAIDVENKNEK